MPGRKLDLSKYATAAGVSVRSLQRYRRDGAPMPKRGEKVAAWVRRLNEWREKNRGKPGPSKLADRVQELGEDPPPSGFDGAIRWDTESRKALALTRLFELQVKRKEYLKREDVVREWAKREFAVRNALLALPRKLARRLHESPSPEFIEAEIKKEVLAILRGFSQDPEKAKGEA